MCTNNQTITHTHTHLCSQPCSLCKQFNTSFSLLTLSTLCLFHMAWRTGGGFILDPAMFVLVGPTLFALPPKPQQPGNHWESADASENGDHGQPGSDEVMWTLGLQTQGHIGSFKMWGRQLVVSFEQELFPVYMSQQQPHWWVHYAPTYVLICYRGIHTYTVGRQEVNKANQTQSLKSKPSTVNQNDRLNNDCSFCKLC